MSSSSPRNANSRSKSSSGEGRKRTQEVETGEGDGQPATEKITPPAAATAAEHATSALDAAAGAASEPRPDEAAAPAGPGVRLIVGPETSPLGREIMGAAQDMAGDWVPEAQPVTAAAPSTPLEMLDETDLIDGAPPGAASGVIVGSGSAPAMRDEEFLRRVVLPPLPAQTTGNEAFGHSYGDDDLEDKTVISDPPSPELLASWARPAGATARALQRRLKAPVELTTIELVGLLFGSALAGGLIGALFMSVPQAAAVRQLTPPVVVSTPIQRAQPTQAVVVPVVTPLPPRPTVEPLPPPEDRMAPADQPTTNRGKRTSRRSAAGRKAVKKEWVDPFEQ